MSMNKDLVAQAVAAIPQWIEFLNKKDAEQDALLEQMKGTTKPTLMQKATSLLKLNKRTTDTILEEDTHQQIAKDDKPLNPDLTPNDEPHDKPPNDEPPNERTMSPKAKPDEMRWAPTDVEEEVNNMFEG